MPMRFAAMCAAYYANLRMNLKMDLPMKRETVLGFYDRLRRLRPELSRFRRYQNELALETEGADENRETARCWQEWVAVRKTSVRAGSVCPESWDDAYGLHAAVIESAPYYLDISALDIDSVEILLGFDLNASGNHDLIVCNALLAGTPMAALVHGSSDETQTFTPVDCQPIFGIALEDSRDLQAHVEVKTRSPQRGPLNESREDPISVYLIIRRYGPFSDVRQLPELVGTLRRHAHDLLDTHIEPRFLNPLRDAIIAGGWT